VVNTVVWLVKFVDLLSYWGLINELQIKPLETVFDKIHADHTAAIKTHTLL